MTPQTTRRARTKFAELPEIVRLFIVVGISVAVALTLISLFGFDGSGVTGWTGLGEFP